MIKKKMIKLIKANKKRQNQIKIRMLIKGKKVKKRKKRKKLKQKKETKT